MADDPHSLLEVRQATLLAQLDLLTAADSDDPGWSKIADDVHADLQALLDARRDADAAALRLHYRVIGAVAVVAAVVVPVFWFSTWNVVPALLALAVGAALLVNPAAHGNWEPRARGAAGVAAVLGALATPLLGGWSALVVLAGIGWWAWRYVR